MGIHARISELEKQLDAEVVLQEEEGHEVPAIEEIGWGHGMTTWDYAAGDSWIPKKTVIDKPAVTEPDVEKRRKARTKLINLKHSLWFFQYAARQRVEEILSIRKSSEEIELDLAFQSIDIYTKKLKLERVVQEEEGHYETEEIIGDSSWNYGVTMGEKHVYIVDQPRTTTPTEEHKAARQRLEEFYHTTKYVTAKIKIEEVLGYVPEGKQ